MRTHNIIDHGAVAEAKARQLSPRSAREAQRVMACLCDPTRLKIVRALQATELAAGDLLVELAAERHLPTGHPVRASYLKWGTGRHTHGWDRI